MGIYNRDFGSLGDMMGMLWAGPIIGPFCALRGLPSLFQDDRKWDCSNQRWIVTPPAYDGMWWYAFISAVCWVLAVPFMVWLCYTYRINGDAWWYAAYFFSGLVYVLDYVLAMIVYDGQWRW